MAYNEKVRDYSINYAKEKLKRVPLDLKKSDYEELAAAAAEAKMSINGYIKAAICEKMERDKNA